MFIIKETKLTSPNCHRCTEASICGSLKSALNMYPLGTTGLAIENNPSEDLLILNVYEHFLN